MAVANHQNGAAAAQDFLEANAKYVKETLTPVLDELVQHVLREKPDDPLPFMIEQLVRMFMERPVTSPFDVLMLEKLSAQLEEQILTLKAKPGIMPEELDEDLLDVDDPDNLFSVNPAEELRQKLAKLTQKKADDADSDDSASDSDDSDDSDDDDDNDDEDDESNDADGEGADKVGEIPGGKKFGLEALLNAPQRLMRPRTSVSAEVFGEFNKRKIFVAPKYPKTAEQKARIVSVLENVFLFQALDEQERNTVILAMEELKLADGTRIIRQGDDGDALYIVDSGTAKCLKIFNFDPNAPFEEQAAQEKVVKICGTGDVFGELALLYNCPRAASVETEGEATLWKLDRETFSYIVKDAAFKKREMYENFLAGAPLLKKCDAYERSKIADALKTQSFEDGSHIVTQGEAGDSFFFIEEGNAVAMKSFGEGKEPVEVMKYKAGDYFGELSILRNAPRAASVIARGTVRVAFLSRSAFKRLLGPMEAILERNTAQYVTREGSFARRAPGASSTLERLESSTGVPSLRITYTVGASTEFGTAESSAPHPAGKSS